VVEKGGNSHLFAFIFFGKIRSQTELGLGWGGEFVANVFSLQKCGF
jgi:hypothetical protein